LYADCGERPGEERVVGHMVKYGPQKFSQHPCGSKSRIHQTKPNGFNNIQENKYPHMLTERSLQVNNGRHL
jgi:hypothetical protein